jgi:hypothetical protein
VKRTRVLGAAAGLLVGLAVAVPAAHAAPFTPPELFVRLQAWDTHVPASDWIPLARAPALDYLGGYQIGYRLQDSDEANEFQRVALTIAGVPDGVATQPYNAEPFCVGRAGKPGDIVEAAPALQFEGDGAYTVKVSVGGGDGDECLAGPSTTGTFSVGVRVAPQIAGEPLTFRARPLPGNPFVGVQAAVPPGGEADVRCALDARVQPDGSLAGSVAIPDPSFPHQAVTEEAFPRPGAWSCVARGIGNGIDENFDSTPFGTPWSAPLPVEVRSDFRRRTGAVARARAKRPRFTFKAEWAALSAGARGRVVVSRVRGCKRHGYRLRKLRSYGGRFGAKRLRLRVRRPRAGFYLGALSFSGTRFIRAGSDPNPVLLLATRKSFGFADPRAFPACRP